MLARMELMNAVQTYFRGERAIGLALVPIGLALIAFAFYVWRTEGGAFMAALSIPLLVVGLAGAGGGVALVVRTDAQVAALERMHAEAPSRLVELEAPRMAKVNANWIRLKIAWTALALVALALLMLVKRDWSTGLGLALLFVSTLAFTVDVFAERRARIYADALTASAPSDAR